MIQHIELKRRWFTEESTIGEIYLDGVFECFMLEDVRRGPGIKVPGKTCIPPGEYLVEITDSPKFKRPLPLVFNFTTADGRLLVKNEGITFEGVRWHTGNIPEHTEGCQLTGQERALNKVLHSTVALDVLFAKLTLEGAHRRFRYTITDEPVAIAAPPG